MANTSVPAPNATAEKSTAPNPYPVIGGEDNHAAADDIAEDFSKGKSWRFWAIVPSLMVTALLSAMEVTGMGPPSPDHIDDAG